MEKYFVPDIEDFRVGYEYEQLEDLSDGTRTDKWIKRKIENNYTIHFPSILEEIINGNIRVPYLTKEAIEEESWEEESNEWLNLDNPKECAIGFRKGTYQLSFADHIELYCSITASVYIIKIYDYYRQNLVYLGECKDINSFRTIMKLLKI